MEKAGTFLKIDLVTAKIVRIVAAIFDRDVKGAEQIVENISQRRRKLGENDMNANSTTAEDRGRYGRVEIWSAFRFLS